MSSAPYVYPGTTVLKNIPGIRNQEILDRFEADRVGQRSLVTSVFSMSSIILSFQLLQSTRPKTLQPNGPPHLAGPETGQLAALTHLMDDANVVPGTERSRYPW